MLLTPVRANFTNTAVIVSVRPRPGIMSVVMIEFKLKNVLRPRSAKTCESTRATQLGVTVESMPLSAKTVTRKTNVSWWV